MDGKDKSISIEDFSSAKAIALEKIGQRECSSREVYQKLVQKGIDQELAKKTVLYFQDIGYIDDQRFARVMIRYHANRGKGPLWIKQKLMEKGVPMGAETIHELMQELTENSQEELIQNLLKRKYPLAVSDYKEKARAFAALLRRGHSYDSIQSAFRGLDAHDFES